jgi:hypothetical protein
MNTTKVAVTNLKRAINLTAMVVDFPDIPFVETKFCFCADDF